MLFILYYLCPNYYDCFIFMQIIITPSNVFLQLIKEKHLCLCVRQQQVQWEIVDRITYEIQHAGIRMQPWTH